MKTAACWRAKRAGAGARAALHDAESRRRRPERDVQRHVRRPGTASDPGTAARPDATTESINTGARAIDYGFSKTREEALEKWGYERVLSDVVRVIRMTRPLVVTSVFVGAPTDGHGNHQVAGQMAQEAFVAAADPKRFPEQLREGLRPWAPVKVYARVPFFAPTKDKTIYDYATDKYVPMRFYDYINKTWLTETPAGERDDCGRRCCDPAAGLTYSADRARGLGLSEEPERRGRAAAAFDGFGALSPLRIARARARTKKIRSTTASIFHCWAIATLAKGDTGVLEDRAEQTWRTRSAKTTAHYQLNSPAAIAPASGGGLEGKRAHCGRKWKPAAWPSPARAMLPSSCAVRKNSLKRR